MYIYWNTEGIKKQCEKVTGQIADITKSIAGMSFHYSQAKQQLLKALQIEVSYMEQALNMRQA